MRYKTAIYVTAVIISLIACSFSNVFSRQTEVEQYNLDLFSDKEYQEGCWNNLCPEITTESTVKLFLLSKAIFKNDYKKLIISSEDYSYTVVQGDSAILFDIEDHLLIKISFDNIANLTLGDVINELGDPEYFQIIFFKGDAYNPPLGTLKLFYPSKGYFLLHF